MTQTQRRASEVVAEETGNLDDLSTGYPANYFAWRIALADAPGLSATSLFEVGVGSGHGAAHVMGAGLSFAGIDRDPACVAKTRDVVVQLGGDESAILEADIESPSTLSGIPAAGSYDMLMALGIMPHVQDRKASLDAMVSLVRPGGAVYLEFRNSLFSLITFNRFTGDFILNDLLPDVSPSLREKVSDYLAPRIDANRPPRPSSGHEAAYDNPLALPAWFEKQGYADISVHPFHYHAAMPLFEAEDPAAFRRDSLALEDDESGWRGLFLCSAFLVKVVRPLDR